MLLLLVGSCGLLWEQPALADELAVAAAVDVGAGIEGGGSGYATGVRRTRTTLRLGAEGHVDTAPAHRFGLGLRVEVEPTASVGADLRYVPVLGDLALAVGATSVLAPETMFGVCFGFDYRFPVSESVLLSVGPTGNVYFAGSDLPNGNALWQAMLQGGIRAQLW